MSNKVADILWEVAGLLNDREPGFEYVRWTKADLLEFMNDGIMQAYLVRPQLFTHNETFNLVPGALQTVPDGCQMQKLLATDGVAKPARTIDYEMYSVYAGFECGCLCGPYQVDGVVQNPSDPNGFYVDPPVPNDGKTHTATIMCLGEPKEVSAVYDANGNIVGFDPETAPMKGKLHNAVVEWMLYRAFSIDIESQPSDAKMRFHLRHFYEMLGLDAKITDKLIAERLGKTKASPSTSSVGASQ